jgi:acyl-CoA synthetase (AMP-forming)/AMP-acid ligase II
MATNFWELEHPRDRLAVVDVHTGVQRTYAELRDDVARTIAAMPPHENKSLIMLLAQNRYECLLAYLAALNSGEALMLVDAGLNQELMLKLLSTYQPDFVCAMAAELELPGYRKSVEGELTTWKRNNKNEEPVALHESLALLLNTSGSTGSPKLVRLSSKNLQSNAESIAQYLALTENEKAITSLPMTYSYGLSVINSHLLAGAALVLTDHGVLRREFWDSVDAHACTSFAGVPYTYQMLLKTGLLKKRGATLRTLTQAGGALAAPHIREMYELALQRGFKFFAMYGQTEATARISYVPFEALNSKVGSIGIAVPNGRMQEDSETGELIYTGANVMMGYAENRADLANGDELCGTLKTGDLARQDADGFFYITGRLKRFLKLFGKRFNLDEVEQIVEARFGFPTACFGHDDLLMVAIESSGENIAPVAAMLCETFALPRDSVRVEMMQKLPRTERGKVDYPALAARNEHNREVLAARTSLAEEVGRA